MPLSAPVDNPDPKIELRVNGKIVPQPYISTVIVKNTGNIPIARDEFDTPIQITIKNETKIVQLRHRLIPTDINTHLSFSASKASIAPALLNPGDTVIIEMFTTGGEPVFDVGARIEGVKKIVSEDLFDPYWGEIGWVQYGSFLISLIGMFIITLAMQANLHSRYVIISRKTAMAFYVCSSLVCLNAYFSMLVDHSRSFFSSRMLLIAMSLLMLLVAMSVLRQTGEEK